MVDSSVNDETFSSGGVIDFVLIGRLKDIIGKSYPTTLRMIHLKQIQAYQVGKEWRIKNTEVRRFLEQGNHPDSKKG